MINIDLITNGAIDYGTVKVTEQHCLHQLFEQAAAKHPHSPAVTFKEKTLSYNELNVLANQVARVILQQSVKLDFLVAVSIERSLEMVVALLGVMKAGCAYVPLDPDYPQERIDYMLQDCGSSLLLCQSHLKEGLSAQNRTLLVVDLDEQMSLCCPQMASADIDNISAATLGLESHHLAYVIYTSGSTGKPKGVCIEHRSVSNLMQSMYQCPGIGIEEKLLALAPYSFDLSVAELFFPLTAGGHLHIAQQQMVRDAHRLAAYITERDIDVMWATPSNWDMLLNVDEWQPKSTFRAFTGGETLNLTLKQKLEEKASETWNFYGPTETTVWSTLAKLDEQLYIGLPIANTCLHLLDENQQPVVQGEEGELYIGGQGLAREYLNRPDLTAEKFVTHEQLGRLYRTGDLVQWLDEHHLHYISRVDEQIKIRGFRVEAGEIEYALNSFFNIKQSCVCSRTVNSVKQLVAYYVTETQQGRGSRACEPAVLYDYLSDKLPKYMVPSAYVQLSSLPRTPSGKVDRRNLPKPYNSAYPLRAYAAPTTDLERQLQLIWQQILSLDEIGITDEFFQLGGFSLSATKMVNRIDSEVGVTLSLEDIFRFPTIEELALAITTLQQEKQVGMSVQEGLEDDYEVFEL